MITIKGKICEGFYSFQDLKIEHNDIVTEQGGSINTKQYDQLNRTYISEYQKAKDQEVKAKMFEKILALNYPMLVYYSGASLENLLGDMFQIACIAAMYAVEKYDVTSPMTFASFFDWFFRKEEEKLYLEGAVYLPKDRYIEMQEVRRVYYEIMGLYSSKVEWNSMERDHDIVQEISEKLGYTVETVKDAFENAQKYYACDLDKKVGQDGEVVITRKDLLPDPDPYIDETFDYEEVEWMLEQAALTPQEKTIVYYKVFNPYEPTYAQIGKKLGISSYAVGRRYHGALKKMAATPAVIEWGKRYFTNCPGTAA